MVENVYRWACGYDLVSSMCHACSRLIHPIPQIFEYEILEVFLTYWKLESIVHNRVVVYRIFLLTDFKSISYEIFSVLKWDEFDEMFVIWKILAWKALLGLISYLISFYLSINKVAYIFLSLGSIALHYWCGVVFKNNEKRSIVFLFFLFVCI